MNEKLNFFKFMRFSQPEKQQTLQRTWMYKPDEVHLLLTAPKQCTEKKILLLIMYLDSGVF